jgi:hypothetical protein
VTGVLVWFSMDTSLTCMESAFGALTASLGPCAFLNEEGLFQLMTEACYAAAGERCIFVLESGSTSPKATVGPKRLFARYNRVMIATTP